MSDGSAALVRRVQQAARGFGVEDVAPWQSEAITAAVDGRDVLVVAPTGAGKSLVYQVAGLLRPGWTLVVSPLLALQADQVEHLRRAEVRATRLSSAEPAGRREETLDALRAGGLDVVLMAPEQLVRDDVRALVAEHPPGLVVIDEAHCVSEWGHDFRPDYLRIGNELCCGVEAPTIAMTATAAPPVRASVMEQLCLADPLVVSTSLERPNLRYAVEQVPDRRRQVERVVRAVGEHPSGTSGIVYTRTRRSAEEVADALRAAGCDAAHFHAGLPARRRAELQEAFMGGGTDVLVATSAFGLGVDKPDVRFVVHVEAPPSLDDYLQESGRAGRDGRPAEVLLVHRPEDLSLGRFFATGVPRRSSVERVLRALPEGAGPDRADQVDGVADAAGLGRRATLRILNLVASLEPGTRPTVRRVRHKAEARRRLERSRVDLVREYVDTRRCRAAYLLGYLGESTAPCGTCDTCEEGAPPEDGTSDLDGASVEHPDFGRGSVMEEHGDRVTVLFEDAGYKTLLREVVVDRDMVDGHS